MIDERRIPAHMGFILDGNRRWAKEHGTSGYDAGYRSLQKVIEGAFEEGVTYVSVYAFSSENWKRGKAEVSSVMKMVVHAFTHDLNMLIKHRIRIRFIGREDGLAKSVLAVLQKAEAATKHFAERTLVVCFNYSGHHEIVDAARACIADGLRPEEVSEAAINARVYAPEVPPVDMIVRTSGEQRLSNFMLWRAAYSELLFIDKHWPDMTKADVHAIIEAYSRRSRRFGA